MVLFFQLHPEIQNQMDTKLELENIPIFLSQLDAMSVATTYDDDAAVTVLKRIYVSMVNFEARRSHDDSTPGVDSYTKYTRMVMDLGGLQVVLRLLMSTTILPETSHQRRGSYIDVRNSNHYIYTEFRSLYEVHLIAVYSDEWGEIHMQQICTQINYV